MSGQCSCFVVAHKIGERHFVQGGKHLREFPIISEAGRKGWSIMSAKGPDQGIAMFLADFTVLVTVTIVQTWLFHEGSIDTADLRRNLKSRQG